MHAIVPWGTGSNYLFSEARRCVQPLQLDQRTTNMRHVVCAFIQFVSVSQTCMTSKQFLCLLVIIMVRYEVDCVYACAEHCARAINPRQMQRTNLSIRSPVLFTVRDCTSKCTEQICPSCRSILATYVHSTKS